MAKNACKCKKPNECEECPEWIFTFADLVMLMMGFFVILWVLKPNPNKNDPKANEDLVKAAASIREAFGYIPDPKSSDPVDVELMLRKVQHLRVEGPGDGGRSRNEPKGPPGAEPEVTSIRPAKQATEGGKLLFEPGGSQLNAETKEALNSVADVIRGHRNVVLVKGHTSLDDVTDGSAQQKMDLSLRRAQAVADYLIGRGVEPEILRVEGCSTFEPLVQREYAPDAQRLNRRVEVEATARLVDELQDPQKPAEQSSGRPSKGATSKPAAD